jgi:hypothetical protein
MVLPLWILFHSFIDAAAPANGCKMDSRGAGGGMYTRPWHPRDLESKLNLPLKAGQ